MPKGTVTTHDGRIFKLAPRQETGLIPCPGEAHGNPYIDNCGLCAPRWGQIMGYAPPTVSQVAEGGFAVAISDTSGVREAFEAAEKVGLVKLVRVTEKWRGVTASYFAYVKGTHGKGT